MLGALVQTRHDADEHWTRRNPVGWLTRLVRQIFKPR